MQGSQGDAEKLLARTRRIVSAYVAGNRIGPAELPVLIASVAAVLGEPDDTPVMGSVVVPRSQFPGKPTPAQIADSINDAFLVSFEDGKRYSELTRHLLHRGITPEAYRAKWGLPQDYPMVTARFTRLRGEISRKVNTGRKRGAVLSGAIPRPDVNCDSDRLP